MIDALKIVSGFLFIEKPHFTLSVMNNNKIAHILFMIYFLSVIYSDKGVCSGIKENRSRKRVKGGLDFGVYS